MKKQIIISLLLLLALPALGKSLKRGVSEDSFSMGSMLEALEPGVTWYYNWANVPGNGYNGEVAGYEDIEFVPMCWNANYDAEAIRNYCKTHPKTKYLLGFNEPNFLKQANMSPQLAAEKWPAVQALARELGLKLVAPALNYSPDAPYQDPLKWMDEFVAIVGRDAFDYVAIHNYGGLKVMKKLAGDFHDRYGKDVWVTEFCYWPNEGDPNSTVAPAAQISAMVETVEWLESTPWIFRYAWFKALGNSNASKGPNYGLLVHEGTGLDPWSLSEQGYVYVGMSDFVEQTAVGLNETVAASEYIRRYTAGLGKSKDEQNPGSLDLREFISGAYVDYCLNVPAEDNYMLRLRISGQGEPVRFDPAFNIMEVDAEGNVISTLMSTGKFAISGSDDVYENKDFPVRLGAGKRYIRIQDANPYSPSGVRISAVSLVDSSGVDGVNADDDSLVNVYSLQGILLKENVHRSEALSGLDKGLYIVGGRIVTL